MIKFNVGDVLHSKLRDEIDPVTNKLYATVLREITEIRETGYTWKYPQYGNLTASGHLNSFLSEDSSDPLLEEWNLFSISQEYRDLFSEILDAHGEYFSEDMEKGLRSGVWDKHSATVFVLFLNFERKIRYETLQELSNDK